jgi:hypothetical protein
MIHFNLGHLILVAGEDGRGRTGKSEQDAILFFSFILITAVTGTILLSIGLKDHHSDPHIKAQITIRLVILVRLSVGIIIGVAIKTVDLPTMAHSLTADQLRIVVEDTLVTFNGSHRDHGTVGGVTILPDLTVILAQAHHRLSISWMK